MKQRKNHAPLGVVVAVAVEQFLTSQMGLPKCSPCILNIFLQTFTGHIVTIARGSHEGFMLGSWPDKNQSTSKVFAYSFGPRMPVTKEAL